MAISIVMPALELAQENGKLVSWQKVEGERVAKGEPLLEVETDKALVEIEAPGDGILAGLKAQAGDVITAVDGQTITGSDDLASATMDRTPGTKVTLTVLRGSSQQNITLTLGERPIS